MFRWHQHKQQWQLDVRDFNLQAEEKTWPTANFSIWAENNNDNSLQKLGANISNVDINEVCDLLQLSSQLDTKQAKLLKKLDPKNDRLVRWITMGNVSFANMVRSAMRAT